MQSKFSSMNLKQGYQYGLVYTIYNGPPQSIHGKYELRHNYTDADLEYAVIKCKNLINYIINPTKSLISTHIQHHGTTFLPDNIEIDRDNAISIIKSDTYKFAKYDKIYNFTDDEKINIFNANPKMLKHIEHQTYDMCIDAINRLIRKNSSKIMTNLFYGGSSLFDEYIPDSFPEYINHDSLTNVEILKIYDVLKKYNSGCVRYMNPKYVNINDFIDYYKRYNHMILFDTFGKFIEQRNLSEDEIVVFYSNFFGNDITMIEYIPHKYQTDNMINMILSAPLSTGIKYYKYLKIIDSIGKDLYIDSFEKNKNNISYMPNEYKTFDICMNAVLFNPRNIEYCPYDLQTQEMCHIAGMHNYELIRYCKYIDDDMLRNVHKQKIDQPRNKRFGFINTFSEDQIIQVMKIIPSLLKIVKNPTHNIIMTALETNGYAIEHVPIDKRTDEYIQTALRSQPKASKFIL